MKYRLPSRISTARVGRCMHYKLLTTLFSNNFVDFSIHPHAESLFRNAVSGSKPKDNNSGDGSGLENTNNQMSGQKSTYQYTQQQQNAGGANVNTIESDMRRPSTSGRHCHLMCRPVYEMCYYCSSCKTVLAESFFYMCLLPLKDRHMFYRLAL